MNYKKIYLSLIKKRRLNPAENEFQYTENHHILPVSIFPQKAKDKDNIVNLSAREHFIAHALLVKYYKQKNDKSSYYKMLSAFDAMSKLWGSNRSSELRYKCGNRQSYLYARWKEQLSKYIKQTGCKRGINSSNYGKRIIHNDNLKKHKYIDKDAEIPFGWELGPGKWTIRSGKDSYTYNRVWCYNKQTNEQFFLFKEEVQLLLKNNKDIVYGISPIAKSHVQQYNPLTENIWISNLELKEFKLWPKNQEIPDGWLRGKVSNFDQYLQRYKLAKQNSLAYFVNYQDDIKNKKLPRIRIRRLSEVKKYKTFVNKKLKENDFNQIIKLRKQKQLQTQKKIIKLKAYYQVYKVYGFEGVVQKFNYPYSKQALVQAFAKYVSDFIPQNGKRRCKIKK